MHRSIQLVGRALRALLLVSPLLVGYMFAWLADDKVLPAWLALLSAYLYFIAYVVIALLFIFKARRTTRSARPS
ncbi:hypothetical protein BVY00_00895 [bacterium G20]|nr:hypothetical protein BVY00_00895 [bacterium G20]